MACQLLPSAAKSSRPLGNLIKVADGRGPGVGLGCMPVLHKPGGVANQINIAAVANSQTGPRAMMLKLALVDHLA